MKKEVKVGRRVKIKPEVYQDIFNKFEEGSTQKELAEEYKCSTSTIYKIIREVRENG